MNRGVQKKASRTSTKKAARLPDVRVDGFTLKVREVRLTYRLSWWIRDERDWGGDLKALAAGWTAPKGWSP